MVSKLIDGFPPPMLANSHSTCRSRLHRKKVSDSTQPTGLGDWIRRANLHRRGKTEQAEEEDSPRMPSKPCPQYYAMNSRALCTRTKQTVSHAVEPRQVEPRRVEPGRVEPKAEEGDSPRIKAAVKTKERIKKHHQKGNKQRKQFG